MMMKYLHNSKYLCMTICNSKWCRYLSQHQMVWILVCISVGSNPNITNFKLLRTSQVELQTHSNPGSSTKTKLRTPSKSLNFEPVQPETSQTQAQIWKNWTSNPSESGFIYQNQTRQNPWTGSDPTLVKTCDSTFFRLGLYCVSYSQQMIRNWIWFFVSMYKISSQR